MATARVWFLALCIACYLPRAAQYILVEQELSGVDASAYCQNTYGTHLASIHSASDNEEAATLCKQRPICATETCRPYLISCYIGLNDRANEQDTSQDGWVWDDASPYDYRNWRATEPNDYGGDEDCASITTADHPSGAEYASKWLDVSCTAHAVYFLCNVPPTNHPTNHPTTHPSHYPSNNPTDVPTNNPSNNPTLVPTMNPTNNPSNEPSKQPTGAPSKQPTRSPLNPTFNPSRNPVMHPITVSVTMPNSVTTESVTTASDDEDDADDDTASNEREERVSDSESVSYSVILNYVLVVMALIILCMIGCCLYLALQYQQRKGLVEAQIALSEARIAMSELPDVDSKKGIGAGKRPKVDENAAAPAANVMYHNNQNRAMNMHPMYGGMRQHKMAPSASGSGSGSGGKGASMHPMYGGMRGHNMAPSASGSGSSGSGGGKGASAAVFAFQPNMTHTNINDNMIIMGDDEEYSTAL